MSALEFDTLGKINQIWTEKKWEFPTTEESDLAFQRFCQMMEHLPVATHSLVMELTRSFTVYSFNNYMSLMVTALRKVSDQHLQGIERIIFAPLLNPSDDRIGKAKSGHGLPYLASNVAEASNKKLGLLDILPLASPGEISRHLTGVPTLIVLVDDFIGSGDTAKNAVWHITDMVDKNDRVLVVALVGMQQAIDYLENHQISAVCGEVLQKGIADNYAIVDKQSAYTMIDEIAGDLNVALDYYRGYKQSEALVKLLRTPDNTFPMYWCKQKRDSSDWPAPFPR